MAKQKQERTISEVSFKDPHGEVHFKSVGFRLTPENITVERYQRMIEMVMPKQRAEYEAKFNIKYSTKQQNDEPVKVEA